MGTVYTDPEWTVELMDEMWQLIDTIGKGYGLDYYEPRIEIVTASQMAHSCGTHGMPFLFNHWLQGKKYLEEEKKAEYGLPYELVINTDPAIAYCMETNSMTMQTLVMAHAICGHSSFFKSNYLFREFTNAKHILGVMDNYKKYVDQCETRYGIPAVEEILDSCFALQYMAADRYRIKPLDLEEEENKWVKRVQDAELIDREYQDTLKNHPIERAEEGRHYAEEDHEYLSMTQDYTTNILKLIGEQSPNLCKWERELISGFCAIQQYFYPQFLTKNMNEGWASFWHYTIMKDLHTQGSIGDGHWLEFIESHSGVLHQPEFSSSINPYTLGFSMFMDLKRICEDPDEEDTALFPDIAGTDWNSSLIHIMENYNDSSFILKYLSPKVIRQMKLAIAEKLEAEEGDWSGFLFEQWQFSAIHNGEDLNKIRQFISDSVTMDSIFPDVKAMSSTSPSGKKTLNIDIKEVDVAMQHGGRAIERLWQGPVVYTNFKPLDITEEE